MTAEVTAEPKVQLGWAALDALKGVFIDRIAGFVSFTDPAGNYPKEERDYKDALVALFHRTIDASLFAAPIGQAEAERIADAVLRVLTGRVIGEPQNLMNFRYYTFLSEAAFRQPTGESESDVVHFARAFGDLLYGPDDSAARVERFNAVMWPIWQRRALTRAVTVSFPTFFLMLHDPAHDIYVRSREFARVSRLLVGYDPLTYDPSATEALGATAYRQVQAIARALCDAFTTWGWQPRDMIDVQTFIYRTQSPAEAGPESTDSTIIDAERPMSEAFNRILASLEATGLHFPPELVANYLLALQTKRFVILTGISGTGKTQMAMAVAAHFHPDVTSDVPLEPPPGAVLVRVAPSMLRYFNVTVPVALSREMRWPPVDPATNSGRIDVETPIGRLPLAFWKDATRNSTVLTLSGRARAWFTEKCQVGDHLTAQLIRTDDAPFDSLLIGPAALSPVPAVAPNRLVVPVRPDWTDNRGLLGWYNPITERYHRTEFLDFLLAANDEIETAAAEPGRTAAPFFVILDEMNLARVEHYFSDFLSAMESGEPIPLHDDDAAANGDGEGRPVPRRLTVPSNLFITGTVNIDETTYMFSAKVLDRAFTIEFNDVDLHGLGRAALAGAFGGATDAVSLSLPRLGDTLTAPLPVGASDWTALRGLADGAFADVILGLHGALAPTNRHFGYRVANEIGRYMTLAAMQSGGSAGALRAALDLALLAKVLPKLHGTQAELGDLIDTLATLAHAHALPRMGQKLARMRRRLESQGFTSFIE